MKDPKYVNIMHELITDCGSWAGWTPSKALSEGICAIKASYLFQDAFGGRLVTWCQFEDIGHTVCREYIGTFV
jgi:hypothetical protein